MERGNLWLLGLSALLIATLIACDANMTSTLLRSSTSRTIQVTGSGSVVGDPDMATLNLGVSVEKKTVAEAREAAADAMAAVIDSLKGTAVPEKDIQTQAFSIHPQYNYTDNGRVLRGYRVSNTVIAKVRELDTLSQVIDGAAEAGGDIVVVNTIQFIIEDSTALQTQARGLAVKNAEAKAQTLAQESGVSLGKPVSIIENTHTVGPPIAFEEAASLAADSARASTPIESGELTITVNVTIVYDIE